MIILVITDLQYYSLIASSTSWPKGPARKASFTVTRVPAKWWFWKLSSKVPNWTHRNISNLKITVKTEEFWLKTDVKTGHPRTSMGTIIGQATRITEAVYKKMKIEGAILFEIWKIKTIFCRILLWKLSRMKENGLTKKMDPNTNIFYWVVNAVQTFKVLFMWRHNVAPNSTCKTNKSSTLF
jgi:hypothetical protein